MPILGTLLKKVIEIRKAIKTKRSLLPATLQKKELLKLLTKAQFTSFGQEYDFLETINEIQFGKGKSFYKKYKEKVPTFVYNDIYKKWWQRAKDEPNVCWPGKVKYFALSSGTSESSSKYIPITKAMTKAIRKTSIRQILSLANYPELPNEVFSSGMLMLGGSTHLNHKGSYFEGDLSGISAKQIPFWFQHFYKPGRKIASNINWDKKLEEIVEQADNWDIGFVVGTPAWIQIMIEKIIEKHQVKNIHEIWPNLSVFAHGGVSFEPYKKSFEKLLGRPLIYIDTYLASEGFIAFQSGPDTKAMKLVLNNGIFFEFVPFNEENFDSDGNMIEKPETFMIDEVEEGKEYAILLSTCAGAWRYLIGDVVKFVSKRNAEIVISGRTKHYISLCGEHLSVENMNHAIEQVSNELNIAVKEFAVAGIPDGSLFAHQWYIGTDDVVDANDLKEKLDAKLKILNDDYAVERTSALKEVHVKVLSTQTFYDFMKHKGKIGGQHKFPRVLKKAMYEEWENFINQYSAVSK